AAAAGRGSRSEGIGAGGGRRAGRRGTETGHTGERVLVDRELLRGEIHRTAAGTNLNEIGIEEILVTDILGDDVEDALQREIAQGNIDLRHRGAGERVAQNEVNTLRAGRGGIVFLGERGEGAHHLAEIDA